MVVSAVVAVALTVLACGAGWAQVAIPACDPTIPLACEQRCIATAGAAMAMAMAMANLLYLTVYSRVFVTPVP